MGRGISGTKRVDGHRKQASPAHLHPIQVLNQALHRSRFVPDANRNSVSGDVRQVLVGFLLARAFGLNRRRRQVFFVQRDGDRCSSIAAPPRSTRNHERPPAVPPTGGVSRLAPTQVPNCVSGSRLAGSSSTRPCSAAFHPCRVGSLAFSTFEMTECDTRAAVCAAARIGPPATDVLRYGCEPLTVALLGR
jgi:hypothetical protein